LPPNSADSALILRVPEGTYTIEISGAAGAMGIVQETIYELSHGGTRLAHASSRGYVGRGRNMMTVGFAVCGSETDALLGRADGPSLRAFGVTGALEKPTLELSPLRDGVLTNAAWGTSPSRADIAAASAAVGALPFDSGSADSAALVSLRSGAYAMSVYGVDESTGVALAEIYEVP
jgi:hypothetical protein